MSSLDALWVLVHSPLVSPSMWSLVAAELERRGARVTVPELRDSGDTARPYWERHAESAARAVQSIAGDARTILVGHSGAGVLLPAIRQAQGRPVAAYLFVDAGLPENGVPRLGPDTPPEMVAHLEAGGRYPEWTDAELADEVPDAGLRAELIAGLRPRAIDFWREAVPLFAGWPDAPCGYLLFTPYYEASAERAQALGWPYRHLPGGHFQMLVSPGAVADALVELGNVCLR